MLAVVGSTSNIISSYDLFSNILSYLIILIVLLVEFFLKINNKVTYLINGIYIHLPPRFSIRSMFFLVVFVRAGLNKASI